MGKQELWVRNIAQKDLRVNDIGVKIKVGQTINVFQFNKYLLPEQVNRSLSNGDLLHRISQGSVDVVAGPANLKNQAQIKVSDSPLKVIKKETTVLVNPKELEVLDDTDLGDIADYGVDFENVTRSQTEDGAVVLNQKQDVHPPAPTSEKLRGQKILTKENAPIVLEPPQEKSTQTPTEPTVVTPELITEADVENGNPVNVNGKEVRVKPTKQKLPTSSKRIEKDEKGNVVMKLKKD